VAQQQQQQQQALSLSVTYPPPPPPPFHPTGESFGMTVIESLSKGVPVIASTAGAVPEILAVPGRHGASPYGAACNTMEEYEAALNASLTRTHAQSLAIQAYARSKYDSHVVVNDLLQFSLDVGGGIGALPSYPLRDWQALMAAEERVRGREGRRGGGAGGSSSSSRQGAGSSLLPGLLAERSKPWSAWYRLGLLLHALCGLSVLAGSRPCKRQWQGKGGEEE
jgi:hypothetical protein